VNAARVLSLPGSLRGRLTLAAVFSLLIGGAFVAPLMLAEIERDGRAALDRDLRGRADGILSGGPGAFWPLRSPQEGPAAPELGFGEGSLLAGSGTFVQVAVGGVVVERRGDVPEAPPVVPRAAGLRTIEVAGVPWRSLTVRFAPADVRIQVLGSLAAVEDRVASVRRIVLLLGLLVLAMTGAAAWGLATLAVRPLTRLRVGAERVSGAEDLMTALPAQDGPDEVRALARSLNEMLARLRASTDALQRALAATRRFAADAGHELRTPLTGMRTNLDTLARNPDLPVEQRKRLIEEMTSEQERIVHLLEGLQALARGEAADSLPREPVELADLLDAALHSARRRAPGIEFELHETVGDARVEGWSGGLRLIAENLLGNAALHGRPDGRVTVSLDGEDGALVLRVQDDGPGIPAADRDRLLEPFARGSGAQAPGSGLGLAIVAQQVELHGGTMVLGESALGGLLVEVRLPRALKGNTTLGPHAAGREARQRQR